MRDVVNKLATADCLLGLAHVALQEGYVRPQFTDDDTLEIVDGRHPMVEALRSDPFVPNSVSMGGGQPRSKIITGPCVCFVPSALLPSNPYFDRNMGGLVLLNAFLSIPTYVNVLRQ